nr:PilZ domain-containing protein [Acidobacteriota bacterium]
MLPSTADLSLRRDELTETLALSPRVIDALISTRALETEKRDGNDVVPFAQLERLFRDTLLRVYQAQAMRAAAAATAPAAVENGVEHEIEIEAAEEELPVITRTADEHLAIAGERPDLRLAARYVPRRQLGGTFRDVKVTVLQLSNSGLRIRHVEALRPGEEARFSFAIQNPPKVFVMRARVVWTSIAQRGDEPSFCISGVRIVANADRLGEATELLRAARELQVDESDTARRARPGKLPMPVSGLPDEDVVAIIRAVRKFAADPTVAARWYTRARFAVADEEVRRAAPRGARDREEVLGIWEYLQRRIDLRAVAGVVLCVVYVPRLAELHGINPHR